MFDIDVDTLKQVGEFGSLAWCQACAEYGVKILESAELPEDLSWGFSEGVLKMSNYATTITTSTTIPTATTIATSTTTTTIATSNTIPTTTTIATSITTILYIFILQMSNYVTEKVLTLYETIHEDK